MLSEGAADLSGTRYTCTGVAPVRENEVVAVKENGFAAIRSRHEVARHAGRKGHAVSGAGLVLAGRREIHKRIALTEAEKQHCRSKHGRVGV